MNRSLTESSSPPAAPADPLQAPAEQAPPDAEILMDHEYDGIMEYDNPMPGWWKALFWATVLFSGVYVFWYHVSGRGPSVEDSYRAEVAEANAHAAKLAMREKVSEAALEKLMADGVMMDSAAQLFAQRCKQCHAERGEGNIGPNLTDHYWIHGEGRLMDIYQAVSEGVLEKGMPAWNKQLAPAELRQVVAFVGTLRGKNIPGKPHEGKEFAAR